MHPLATGLPFYRDCPEDIWAVSFLLRGGQAVALPTETVYGLAAHALDENAVQSLFQIKGRPLIDPLIVHVQDITAAQALGEMNTAALKLAQAFWPGPLTLIVPKKACVPDLVTAGHPSVALRIPSHPVFRKVLACCQLPLAAPSANPFGYVSPTRAAHVRASLGHKAPYILEGGPCEHGLESTIILLTDPKNPCVLRPGPIGMQALEAVLEQKVELKTIAASDQTAQLSPGLLSQHYSPRTPLKIFPFGVTLPTLPGTARVFWKRPKDNKEDHTFWLSENGNSQEAAQNVYHLLQTLDQLGVSVIYWEIAPEGPLEAAINNRLIRAAAKTQA